MTFEERILQLELKFKDYPGQVPGTSLSRTLFPDTGFGWTLAFGGLTAPKRFFTAPTIEECINQAEQFVNE